MVPIHTGVVGLQFLQIYVQLMQLLRIQFKLRFTLSSIKENKRKQKYW